jgi:hypothetical protein
MTDGQTACQGEELLPVVKNPLFVEKLNRTAQKEVISNGSGDNY